MDLGLTGAPRPELLKIEQDIKEPLRNHTKYKIVVNSEYISMNTEIIQVYYYVV